MTYDEVRARLLEIFTSVLYPAVVVAVFAYVPVMLTIIVSRARNTLGGVRRATGAVLPFVVLVFMLTTDPHSVQALNGWVTGIPPLWRLVVGAGIGLVLMESGKLLLEADHDGAAALYALFVATLGAFLLWATMGGMLESLHFVLLGLIVAGGLHVVFRGPPALSSARGAG